MAASKSAPPCQWFSTLAAALDPRSAPRLAWLLVGAARIAARLAHGVVEPLVAATPRLTFAIDDTPTERYGRKVEGAGTHHNPTLGPAGSRSGECRGVPRLPVDVHDDRSVGVGAG